MIIGWIVDLIDALFSLEERKRQAKIEAARRRLALELKIAERKKQDAK